MDRGRPVLIAAASGRALAASARRAGYLPLVADRFGDQDTLAIAADHVRVDLSAGEDDEQLIASLRNLSGERECTGIVCGSGFEDRTALLARIGEHWTLLGNNADTIAAVKDPMRLSAICRAADIPHPETSLTPPADPAGWLIKRVGGAGGWHVRECTEGAKAEGGSYFQRRVEGVPISALFLGDGRNVMVLGFSLQWSAPAARHPFRYGGALRPAPITEEIQQALTAAIGRLNAVVSLVGINSADFMTDGHAFHLLEINPRPGATFDLFDTDTTSLFALHLAACAGMLPPQPLVFDDVMAGAIVYARHEVAAVPALDWPDWTADRPVAESPVEAEQPLCSVFARAANAQQARELVEHRQATIHALIDASAS
jgi:predicted ATP-grasp superfamily ATP-dependent carboligase